MGMRSAALIVIVLLAACGTTPRVRATGADAAGVTYEFPDDLAKEAARRATLYCANLGRGAVLQEMTHRPDGAVVASYECR
jgi:hypothetical protein